MAFAPWQIKVLQHYNIVDANGALVMFLSKVLKDDEPGPKVDPEVLRRLFSADTTPNHKWSALHASGHSWIFFQAGGGEAAVRQSEQALSYLKQRFIHVYSEELWHQHAPGISREVGINGSADQDVCHRMRNCFGFFRNWPGRDNAYEKVVVTLTTFLQQHRKLVAMNQTVPPSAVLPVEPSQIATIAQMHDINGKVANWVAAKRVRTDVRVASHRAEDWIYNDDYIMAVAPLTYAAAVKYGWHGWDIAEPQKFASVAQGELERNPWDTFLAQGGLVIFLQFHVPVPRWVTRSKTSGDSASHAYSFENLLLNLSRETASQNPDNWSITDEEQNEQLTVAQVKDMIRYEAQRAAPDFQAPDVPVQRDRYNREVRPHPVYQAKSTFPVERGRPVLADQKEAEEVIAHLDLCLAEIQRWAKKFKGKFEKVVPTNRVK